MLKCVNCGLLLHALLLYNKTDPLSIRSPLNTLAWSRVSIGIKAYKLSEKSIKVGFDFLLNTNIYLLKSL
jgi:hypothetical protein